MLRGWMWGLCLSLGVAGPGCAGVAFVGLGFALDAQATPLTPRPRQVSVADGLPSNRINGFAEDAQGYLWLASSDGLARYDGRGYRIWRMPEGLKDDFLWSVHVDAHNRVWIGTRNAGLLMLDTDRRGFRQYDRRSLPAMGSDTVWAVTSTPDGDLWFGTGGGGLHRLRPDGSLERFMPIEGDPRSLPDASVSHLAVSPSGELWVGTKAGVARWTGRDFEPLAGTAGAAPLVVNGLTFEADGTLWIGTPHGMAVRQPDGTRAVPTWAASGKAAPSVLHVLLRDRAGNYWLDTRTGLGRQAGGAVSDVGLYSPSARAKVRPNWSAAYEDREGGLWFASTSDALWHLPANWRQFAVLSRDEADVATLGNTAISDTAPAADGGLWLVGGSGVLDWLDPATGAVKHRLRDIGGGYPPTGVHADRAGRVWMGYFDGVARFDPATNETRRWTLRSAVDPSLPSEIEQFSEAGNGWLWMSSEVGGLQARDLDGHVRDTLRPGDGRGLDANAVVDELAQGPDGALWVAGSTGLLALDHATQRLAPVPGAPAEAVSALAYAKDGTLWVGRMGAVEHFRWTGARLERIGGVDYAAGFPALKPSALAVDRAGALWATSTRGLVRVDPGTGKVRAYGVYNGLAAQEFRNHSLSVSRAGPLAAGTPEGLVLFDPATVVPSRPVPAVVVEAMRVRRGDRSVDLFGDVRPQILADDRDLTVVARLLSFTDAQSHAYRFRLHPFDTDWVEVGPGGERVFSRLSPGDYRLELQARTADNRLSAVKTLVFTVQPPWWRSPWGLATLGVAALVLAALLLEAYRRRLRRRANLQLALHKQELAEQASLAKTRFLATLGHEVRTPMTGVLGMAELLLESPLDARQAGYAQAIRRAGSHLLRLVNDTLDLATIEAGRLRLDAMPFDLRALLGEVAALTGPMARQRGLAFDAHVDDDVPAWLRGDPGRVRQVLLNLLNNAIKFTEQGGVGLRVSAPAVGGVRFDVVDTGPGLDADTQARLFQRFEQADGARTQARYGGSGLGLAISRELAAAMGGRVDVESAVGAGARFIVALPLEAVAPGDLPVDANVAVYPDPAPFPGTAGTATSAAMPPAGSIPGAAAVLPPLSLLLVEDDATVADVIAGLLRARGHTVVVAGHGLAALAIVASAGMVFDAVLLDLDLPGLDGLALARQLRGQGLQAPFLAVSARSDAGTEREVLAAGFNGFLRKPVTGAQLVEALAAAQAAYSPQASA